MLSKFFVSGLFACLIFGFASVAQAGKASDSVMVGSLVLFGPLNKHTSVIGSFKLLNSDLKKHQIVRITSKDAESVMLLKAKLQDNVIFNYRLKSLTLNAGTTLNSADASLNLAVVTLKRDFADGETVSLKIWFADGSTQIVNATIQ